MSMMIKVGDIVKISAPISTLLSKYNGRVTKVVGLQENLRGETRLVLEINQMWLFKNEWVELINQKKR